MAAPYILRSLRAPTLIQRLLRRKPRKNAVLAVENLLASASNIRAVSADDVYKAGETHGVLVTSKFPSEMQELYRRYLERCLHDRHLSEEEATDLAHLQSILGLSATATNAEYEKVCAYVYGNAVQIAVQDGRLSEDEREFLGRLAENLKLPESMTKALYRDAAGARYNLQVSNVVADERISPEEDADLVAVAQSLGLDVEADRKTQAWFDRLRLYWNIENGQVPAFEVDERLQKSEQCYAVRNVSWYENRTITKSYRYGGLTGRVRLAKGIYFRVGEVAVQRVQEDILKHIDSGRLLLTNKRILFRGQKKNSTIQLKKVIDFTPFRNGLQVEKDTGRPVFLEFAEDIDVFALTLDRALRDVNA